MSYRGIISLMPKTSPFTVSYYKADGNALDSQGSNNGTLVNGTTYGTGIINQGFYFDGINDYVNMGNVLDFNGSTPFSLSMWLNANAAGFNSGGVYTLTGKQNPSSPYTGYGAVLFASAIRLNLNDQLGGTIAVQTAGIISPSTWYHIAITYNGSKSASGVNIYIDGTLRSVSVINNTFTGSSSNSANFTIGCFAGISNFFNGTIDEYGIIDRVLTPTEITNLYNGGLGKQSIP